MRIKVQFKYFFSVYSISNAGYSQSHKRAMSFYNSDFFHDFSAVADFELSYVSILRFKLIASLCFIIMSSGEDVVVALHAFVHIWCLVVCVWWCFYDLIFMLQSRVCVG